MESTNSSDMSLRRLIFIVSTVILACIALKERTGLFVTSQTDKIVDISQNVAKASKKEKLVPCVDGKVYDSIHAPIYHGDQYGDSAKQAKKLRKYIRPYLKKKGYVQYTDIIVAMCAQESRFGAADNRNWMQVKGYCGKAGRNSVKAGVDHFIRVLELEAEPRKCKDVKVVIQAYNFGSYYVEYCMKHGGKDTKNLRANFQAMQRSRLHVRTYGDLSYVERIMNRVEGVKP